jgi:N-acetyl-S-(2-succino)cysteine monooxygenase
MTSPKRQLKLASFYFPPGAHQFAWRLPGAIGESDMDFRHYVHMAKTAERGKLDTIFFQDTAAVTRSAAIIKRDPAVGFSSRSVRLEPMTVLPALAAVTKHIGLIATGTTTYNEPYHIARKFATIDHISGGRAGWNLVTSQNEDEAGNFGRDSHLDHELRYKRAVEFYEVVIGLWDSWEEDAILRDKQSGVYFDADKVHPLNHRGEHFAVRGPLNVARSPQGRPVIAQAGSSDTGRELAARTAEVVFTAQTTLPDAQAFYADVKGRMAHYGRSADDMKIMPGFVPLVGRTTSEAEELFDRVQSLITDDAAVAAISRLAGGIDLTKCDYDAPLPDLPPSNAAKARQKMLVDLARRENLTLRQVARHFARGDGHRLVWGRPSDVADQMEEWLLNDGCDGFCLLWPYMPKPIDDFVNLVVPELQRRGIFRTEYEGRTLRENLGLRFPVHPAAARRAAAD